MLLLLYESLSCLSLFQIFTSLLPTSRMVNVSDLTGELSFLSFCYTSGQSWAEWILNLNNMSHNLSRSCVLPCSTPSSPAFFPLLPVLGRTRAGFLEQFPTTYASPCTLMPQMLLYLGFCSGQWWQW